KENNACKSFIGYLLICSKREAGIATHYVPREKIPTLIEELIRNDCNPKIINEVHPQEKVTGTIPNREVIDRIFDKGSVEEIISALKKENTEWSNNILKKLSTLSPT